MVELIVLNSNLTIIITMQNWPQDTISPFSEALIKKGFTVNKPTTIQQMQVHSGPFASKATTTGLGVDYVARRIALQITNNITSPNENLNEVFTALKSIGYPPEESIERLDIQGTVTIKTQGDNATTFVPNMITDKYAKKLSDAFGREMKVVGMRITTKENLVTGTGSSPFVILLEPLFTDPTDTKLLIQITYSTNNGENALIFLKNLYDTLKKMIMGLKE